MENTGTWNSDYAIMFFAVLISPFFLYFLGRFLALAMEMSTPRHIPQPLPEKIDPIKISIDFSADLKNAKPEPPKPKKKPSKAKTKATVAKKQSPPKPKTNPFEADVVSILQGLAVKKKDALNLVRSLCAKKEYNSLESLIDDCFMCMNKS